ncbi:MAG: sugar ABC transporter substrate-binding protein [candidate division KSB1 bacterium]|nr:sugar ABC transporter substrate-binding protein [candidate division KSB1 bacterium]
MRSLVVVIVALAVASCGPQPAQRRTITFWAMGAEGEAIGKLVPAFEKRHPDLRVVVQSIPWSAAHEKLLTAYAGSTLPDVAQLGNTWLPEFQAIGALVPLDEFLAGSACVPPDSYFAGIWEINRLGGKIYGVPWYVDTRVLFYRCDIFREAGLPTPPNTWEEWIESCARIRKTRPGTYPVFFSLIHSEWQVPVILVLQNEGTLLRENHTRGSFDSPPVLEAFRFYLSFFEGGFAPRRMTEFANLLQAFVEGNIAMFVTGPWNVGELRRRYPADEEKWATAPLPGRRNRLSVAGGSSLVVFRTCQHREAAWKWIEFLSEPSVQVEFFRLTGDLPPRKDTWHLGLLDDSKMVAFYRQLRSSVGVPRIAEWEQVATKMQEHLETVVLGRRSLEGAVKALDADVDRILEKRRWLLARGLLAE